MDGDCDRRLWVKLRAATLPSAVHTYDCVLSGAETHRKRLRSVCVMWSALEYEERDAGTPLFEKQSRTWDCYQTCTRIVHGSSGCLISGNLSICIHENADWVAGR
jgi:hypothetical protein